MTSVIRRRPAAARERTAKVFYFYLGYFPSAPRRRLRWTAEPSGVVLARRAKHQAEVARLQAVCRTCDIKDLSHYQAELTWHQARVMESFHIPVNPYTEA